jgi:1-acyl-sn-glycerol-3-phosphate acyltransferase
MNGLRTTPPRRGAARRHPLRVTGRFIWFAGAALAAALDFLFRCAFRPEKTPPSHRALWMQRHARSMSKIFRLETRAEGPVPARGLLISNHLGYLDILVLASVAPAVFVAKRDVKFWPVVGVLAQMGGTLFVNRKLRAQVGRVKDEIDAALNRGALVVLFPEGTSSDGRTVLPFKSSLLEPAAQPAHPLTVGAIQYSIGDGDAGEEVCYWGDHTFFPHLLNLMGKRAVRATVRFAPFQRTGADRKQLALELRGEILRLKDSVNPPPGEPDIQATNREPL